MSTLCAYENYLRDRYVLGQSVHYAAGANSPKPKSYDREGNEYVWSDEAGDYVRQVGGPGGGRTIRLSEVEKAEIDPTKKDDNPTPPNEQVNTDSAQHGSNVVPAVDEPKNEQADLPPKRKNIGINSFGRYAPTRRDVEDFLRLGKAALEGKSAAVAKGIKRYLQGAGIIDSGLGLTPLGQMLKEDRLRAAPYALINLVYNDPQIRWFYEKYGDGEYHRFEEVYHDLVDAGYSKNVAKELVAGYKKFVSDPALDVFPVGRLDDKKTFQIESAAPFVAPEHIVYALHSFADKFLNDFPYLNLSKLNKHPLSPFNVFQADKENAKSLLFGASAKYPNLISATFTHDLEKIGLGHEDIDVDDVFRELTSDTETEKTDETTKDPEESGPQLNVSGLGLPGKSDVSLKPDVTENKDAAYFIRRDLEATPKDATDSRQLQDNQHIQDDNGRSKENRGAESSKNQDVSQATRHTTEPLPELKGSKSQVEQANKIRDRVYNWALYTSYFDKGAWMEYNSAEKDFYDLARENSDLYADEALRRFFSENDSARFWIDNEKDIRNVLHLYLRRAVPNILKEGWRPTQENREDVDRRRREAKKLLDTKWDDPNTYRKKALPQFEEAKKVRRVAEQASGIDSREEALKTAKQLKSLAYYAATKGDIETVTICRDVVANLNKKFGQGEYDQLQEWEEMLGRTHTRASNNAEKKRAKEERERKRAAKEPVKNERGSSEPTQEQPAKPRPERWTPLKSKMNDDDRRVVENTRKRLNYGLSELAWRLGNAKEKGDVQRVKQLVATAANHYLEQARRAYRSHGGTEALAAFDEALGGDGLTVGQLRDRIVDKFRKIARMEANDLFKFAGERLDEFESFADADSEPIANKEIHLNSIRDKNGKWEDLDDKDSEVAVEDGKPTTLFPDEHFGRRMGSERGLADAVRRALKSMTRKGEYRDSFENGAEYAVPKYNIDTSTRMGRFLAHGYKDSLDGKPVSRDDYSEQRYQELLKKFPTDRESRKLSDLFNSNNREVNKLIKENEDEYKQSENKSGVVQRVVDGIRDLLSRRRQNGSVETPSSESLRNGTAGEVLETGGTDRPSDGGDGRNLASVIAEEAQKSDIPESRVREELDAPRQPKISPDSQKAVQSLRNLIQRVYDHDGLAERIKSRATDAFGDALSVSGETGFESTGEHDKHLFKLADELDKAKKKLEKAQERFDKKPDSEKLERAVDKAEDAANEIEDRLAQAVDEFVQLHGGKSKVKRPASVAKKETPASTSTPHGNEKPDWLEALESQEELKPVSRGKYNPNAKPYSWKEKRPETEDELREYWREHVDGGEDEEVSFGSDGERVSVGEQSGDAPMTPDELRRFAQLRHGRELRKSLGLSEHFSEKELKGLQEPSEKRGRGRPTKTLSEATQRVAQEAQKSEVPQEQVQERIAEALGTPSDTSKQKSSRRPQKTFDPDSIKDDVEKAIQIRDADRSQLSVESIDSIMSIAQKVSDEYGVDGLKDFMRLIDVVPIARSIKKLQKELRDFLEDYSLNRYKATVIREG